MGQRVGGTGWSDRLKAWQGGPVKSMPGERSVETAGLERQSSHTEGSVYPSLVIFGGIIVVATGSL